MISKKSVQCVIDHNKHLLDKVSKLYKEAEIDLMNVSFPMTKDTYQTRMTFYSAQQLVYKEIIEDLESIIND